MIGVVAQSSDHPAVREFFELFKTPWQMYRDDAACDVLLCANGEVPRNSATLVLIFDSKELSFDRAAGFDGQPITAGPVVVSSGSERFPIHGAGRTFRNGETPLLAVEETHQPIAVELARGEQKTIRIGYDLFGEIRLLLSHGQPAEFAGIPTLDLHIAFLRHLMVSRAREFFEIPPVPEDYNFIACLTHDVDHPLVRNHRGDYTILGFVGRALVGSLIDWARGRGNFRQVVGCYRATFSLPFVYVGRAKDFWNLFDRYTEIEEGARSTFFVIPEHGNPGRNARGRAPAKRAAKYHLSDLADELRRLLAAGREVAVHGIDAWCDPARGRVEREKIQKLTGAEEIGVRMHWLYYDAESPARLEEAGYSYDSTVGYNDAVGYRAGTVQVFRPLTVERLLELPMHIMDTAMFYLSYLSLSPAQATRAMDVLLAKASVFGGVLTVNWHDRSLGPERYWDAPYIDLIAKLQRQGAWMPTAADAVSWFRQRRAVVLEGVPSANTPLPALREDLPGLRLRTYRAGSAEFTDVPLTRSAQLEMFQPASAAA